MRHARRVATVVAVMSSVLVAWPIGPAVADGADTLRCLRLGPIPVCQEASSSTQTGTATLGGTTGCDTSTPTCPTFATGPDGCRYTLTEPSAATIMAMAANTNTKHGAWYIRDCGNAGTARQSLTFLSDPPVGDPQVLAQHARAILDLPPARIVTAGDPDTPSALWLDPNSWQSRSTTASADGVSVTVTASAQLVVWQFADATAVLCNTPATPWMTDSVKASMGNADCGPQYPATLQLTTTRQITVTVLWSLTASGDADQTPLAARTTSVDLDTNM